MSQVEAHIARREGAKAREESPDLMAAGAANIMGGDDSFAAAKARYDSNPQRTINNV